MRNTLVILLAASMFACSPNEKKEDKTDKKEPIELKTKFPVTGSVERENPAINDLIKSDAKIEVLTDSVFTWSEGPVWVSAINSVLFSDVPENKMYKWNEKDGLSLYLEPSGTDGQDVNPNESGSNGLTLDLDGKLVLAQHGNRRVSRMEASFDDPKPIFKDLASSYDGKKFSSPNDVIFDSKGNMYFTDPPYGLKGQDDSPQKEIKFNGVYKLDTDGVLTIISKKLTRPNGLALSPDEDILYVANSDPEKAIWMAYELSENGVESERLFFDATSMVATKKGLPDGLRVDKKGNIFGTGPGGVLVFNANGEHLGTINTGVATANCEFNADQTVLLMTAHKYLMRIKLK